MPNFSPDRWQNVRRIFDAALDYPTLERPGFLTRECAGDAEVRAEVESLLKAHDREDDRVEQVVGDAIADAKRGPLRVGTTLGPYRLGELIGEGGMGSVYLADRTDETFEMSVAIKVVRGGLDSTRVIERFREERRILATLDHPNIARILDGGTTDDGLPYLVMEYIRGVSLDHYCADENVDLRARVRLFRLICGGVDHAHRQLVVHRDLKPANVLVTPEGVPKLLDFGIAKILEVASDSGGLTQSLFRPMTPHYASPEQIRGEPVSTATDVHALGILLYELLTGRHPFSSQATTPRELEEAVLNRDPNTPSTVVSRQGLAGDLDNIVMKALAKDPERRYARAADLSADLGRFLDGHPVTARPATFNYRAGKFLRRNVAGVTIAFLFLATIVGAAVISTRAYLEADRMRLEAETQRDRLKEVNTFLARTFQAASPEQRQSADEVTARQILDAGAVRVSEDLSDQPAVAAALQSEIGKRYLDLGVLDQAEKLLLAAVSGYRATGEATTPAGVTATVYFAQTRMAQGEVDDAIVIAGEAVRDAANLKDDDFDIVVEAQRTLAEAYSTRGDYAEAGSIYERLLQDLNSDPWREDVEFVRYRVSVANDWGLLQQRLANYEEAERSMRAAIKDATTAHGATHSVVGELWTNLAFILTRAGRPDEAAEAALQGLEIHEHILGEDHLETAISRLNYADALSKSGRTEEAEIHYPRVLEIFKSVYGERHNRVATVLNNIADALMKQGAPDRALPKFRESAEIFAENFGDEHVYTASVRHNLANALRETGQVEAAEQSGREVLEIRRRIYEDGHPDVARSLILLSQILRPRGDLAQAEPGAREAVMITARDLTPEHPVRIRAERELAHCLVDLDRPAEARTILTAAHAARLASFGPEDRLAKLLAEEISAIVQKP